MSLHPRRRMLKGAVGGSILAVLATPLAVIGSAEAAPAGDQVVINEVYLNGGSAGASYVNKYVELYNPTASAVDLDGWTVQYRPATGIAAFSGLITLTGNIQPGGTYLVGGASNGANGAVNPTPDAANAVVSFSGSAGGTIALAKQTAALTGLPADVLADPDLVDIIGYGTSNTVETTAATGYSLTASLNRTSGLDTNNNAADFSAATPSPVPCGTACVDVVDPDPTEATIAEIQGPGAASPFVGQKVITRGVVTAAYPTGGFSGFYIQTEGSGGTPDATPGASDGVFVFGSAFVGLVEVGDFVEVTGTVSEFGGLTEVTPQTDGVEVLLDAAEAIKDSPVTYPATDAGREALEGMLIQPQGDYTVTDNFSLNNFGEIGLAAGTETLKQPTDVAPPLDLTPGADNSEYNAVVADNAARKVALDDGSSTNYLSNATNKAIPLPWLTVEAPIRVGAAVTFTKPVIIDYRNNAWKFQPTEQLTADNDEAVQPATFEDTREAAPRDVGGDVTLASFNVLNYFTETGQDHVDGGGTCEYFNDRAGNPITVDECSGATGPRGAANDENFARQQAKIVEAINTLDASVVSLEEIENSSWYSDDRDQALAALVTALNDAAGDSKWSFVESPAVVPTGEDVIRTAFIYQADEIEPIGDSEILDDAVFANARAPLAQAFKPVGGDEASEFVAVVNHFKSKSSGTGEDADMGDGQGASNHSRTLQAHALVDFADDFAADAGTDKVYLLGDFNAYTLEDPMEVLYDAGYIDLGSTLAAENTYLFGGLLGSLDHVLASSAGFRATVDADVWNINSVESVALEYSRFNYNVTNFYDATSPFRSSDHDPLIVGLDLLAAPSTVAVTVADTTYGTAPRFDVTVTSDPLATGRVEIRKQGALIASGSLSNGAVSIKPGRRALEPGDHVLTVRYLGNDKVAPSQTTVSLTVAKVTPTLDTSLAPTRVIVKRTKVKATVVVSSNVVTPTGKVTINHAGKVLATGNLFEGRVTLTLPVFATTGNKVIRIQYGGDTYTALATTPATIKVVKQ